MKYTEETLICEKCEEPLAVTNMLDDKNNLIGYSYSCRTCGYSLIKKMSKKTKKVYCKNCKYYRHNMRIGSDIPEKDWREWDECHSKNRIYEITPIQKIDITHPNIKNKNNNCKDFKRKK